MHACDSPIQPVNLTGVERLLCLRWSGSCAIFGASMKRTLTLFLCLIGFAANAADRPNILWIYLEDVSGWFSCYGDKIIKTPNFDNLAASGIRFDRFYTPAGVCSATRSSIIVGVMQTSFGIHNHRSGRPDFRGKNMG